MVYIESIHSGELCMIIVNGLGIAQSSSQQCVCAHVVVHWRVVHKRCCLVAVQAGEDIPG